MSDSDTKECVQGQACGRAQPKLVCATGPQEPISSSPPPPTTQSEGWDLDELVKEKGKQDRKNQNFGGMCAKTGGWQSSATAY